MSTIKLSSLNLLKPKSDEIQGVTPLTRVMRELKMVNKDASKFLLMFEDIDTDHNGLIDINELWTFLKWNSHEMCRKNQFLLFELFMAVQPPSLHHLLHASIRQKFECLKVMDGEPQKALRLKYIEFFVAIYNFNTLDQNGIVKFTFDMLDTDKSGHLQRFEIEELVRRFLNTKEKKVEAKVEQLMFFLDEDRDGGIEFEEFWRLHKRMSLLIFPIFRLQVALRRKLVGNAFWNKAQKSRHRIQRETGFTPIDIYFNITGPSKTMKQNGAESLPSLVDSSIQSHQFQNRSDDIVITGELDDTEPPITAEEAEDLIAKVQDEENEYANRLEVMQRKLRKPQKNSNQINVITAKPEPEPRVGEWWIEDERDLNSSILFEDDRGRFGKSRVGKDMADVLDDADRSRLRAIRLGKNAGQRANLLRKIENSRARAFTNLIHVENTRRHCKRCRCLCCCMGGRLTAKNPRATYVA